MFPNIFFEPSCSLRTTGCPRRASSAFLFSRVAFCFVVPHACPFRRRWRCIARQMHHAWWLAPVSLRVVVGGLALASFSGTCF